MRRRRHRSSALGATFLVLASLGASLLGAEIVLRLLMPDWREFHSGWFMEVQTYPGYVDTTTGRPGFDGWFAQNNGDFRVRIRINQFGLRNDEPVEAADGRLWVIGDSMSFGWGVEREKTYTQVIQDTLGAPAYNVASPGTGVCSWQTLYARMPKELKPSAVVVGLTVENRIWELDCAGAVAAQNAPKAMEEPGQGSDLMSVKMFLTRNMALYNFFVVSLKRVGGIEAALTAAGLVRDAQTLSVHGRDPERVADMIRTTADELANLRAMVPTDVPFVVALFPARSELRDGNAQFRDLRVGEAAALAERGIDAIDLYEPFMAAGYEPTHFAHDGHWSELGHQIAGKAIARWFADKGLLAPPPPAEPAPAAEQPQ